MGSVFGNRTAATIAEMRQLAIITGAVLFATVAGAAARGVPTRELLIAAVAAVAASLGIGALPALARARATPIGFALALTITTIAFWWVEGPRPSVWIAGYAPLLVLAAGALGATIAFAIADGLVLVWAALAGLGAGGWLVGESTLPVEPFSVVLALGFGLLFLNGVVLTVSWILGARDPVRIRELERLAAERDRLADQITQWEPLAASGRLVANVAHEVSNPLQAMYHIVHVLLEDTPSADPRREQILLLRAAIERISEYLEQLSDFYRPCEDAGPSDVNAIVGDVCRFLGRQLETANVKVSQDLEHRLPAACIGETALRQALLNVVLNAVESMEHGGELQISTRAVKKTIHVIVRDTGCGIAAEELEHVFEPFWSGRGAQGGTGLGLTLTQRMLRRCGGGVRVASTLGLGTEITLELVGAEDAQ